MTSIPVRLKDRSYSIQFGDVRPGLGRAVRKLGFLPSSKIFIVSAPNLKRAGALSRVVESLRRAGFRPSVCLMSDRETRKNHKTLLNLYASGLNASLDRRSLILAVGGGVVTDVAGFFAATYMRGVSFVSVPTTLLGMVDASIGGKTAVDLPNGKNLVGAFWQPSLVWVDPAFLKTLPLREWKTGMAEVVKYGVILDRAFFHWLEKKIRRRNNVARWQASDVKRMVWTSARLKAAVVSADEKEVPLKGGREILNFGHTIGHALEAATGYSRLTHGEAISIGMVAAGRLAFASGLWSPDAQLRLSSMLEALRLPTRFPRLSAGDRRVFWRALARDKKHIGGSLRFVLPERLGLAIVRSGLHLSSVKSALVLK